VHKHRDACAACDKHRVIFFEQFFNEHALSDDYVGFYFNTEQLHSVNLLFHERFRKSEFGNSVYEHSACFVQRFEYRHINTCASKVRTARKSGRAGTDNRNALAYRLSRIGRNQIVFVSKIGNVAFQIADCDASAEFFTAYAIFFALVLLRTYSSANRREIVVCFQNFYRTRNVSFSHFRDEIGNMHSHRATAHARSVFAI